MSESLRRHILSRFFSEFLFFFSVFYLSSVLISFIRYGIYYGFGGAKAILLFSIYVVPFTISFSFFISIFFTFRELRKKLRYLRTFGLSDGGLMRFVFMLSVLFYVVTVATAFVISPRAFYLLEESISHGLRARTCGDGKFLSWKDKLIYAEKISLDRGEITAENGFLFDGEKTIRFRKIRLQIRTPDSRFSRDLAELLEDGGELERKEVLYVSSAFLSPVSCSPAFGHSYIYILCNPVIIMLSKLVRDSLPFDTSLFVSFMIHAGVFVGTLIFARTRKYER